MDSNSIQRLMKARKAIIEIDKLEMALGRNSDWVVTRTDMMILDIVQEDIVSRTRDYYQRLIRKIIGDSTVSGEIELAWEFRRKIHVSWRKEIWHDGINYKLKIKDMKDGEATEYRFVIQNQHDNISVYVTGRDLY